MEYNSQQVFMVLIHALTDELRKSMLVVQYMYTVLIVSLCMLVVQYMYTVLIVSLCM